MSENESCFNTSMLTRLKENVVKIPAGAALNREHHLITRLDGFYNGYLGYSRTNTSTSTFTQPPRVCVRAPSQPRHTNLKSTQHRTPLFFGTGQLHKPIVQATAQTQAQAKASTGSRVSENRSFFNTSMLTRLKENVAKIPAGAASNR